MCAGVVNAPLNLIDGVVDQADGSLAMAAFVRFGDVELIARGPEMLDRGGESIDDSYGSPFSP